MSNIKKVLDEATDRLAEALCMKPSMAVQMKIVEAQEKLLDLMDKL